MDKKNNMKQAMYEMFGVGPTPGAAAPAAATAVAQPKVVEQKKPVQEPEIAYIPPKPKAEATYLAAGTVMEGTLRSKGDVEIAGDFKGDIITEGTVILHSNIQGNLSVSSLNLDGCKLVGDVVATDAVSLGKDSEICGNITAKQLTCCGRITGDLNISGHIALESSAQIDGNITMGSISVVRGAVINGSVGTQKAGK